MEDIERHLLDDLEESKPVRDTWDIPFNPSKTVSISDPEIVKKLLNFKRKGVECSHKPEDFKCLCGTFISGTKCKKCDTIFCNMKTCSASKPGTYCNGTAGCDPEDIRDLKVDEKKPAEYKDLMKMEKNSETVEKQAVKQRINPFRVSSNLPVNAVLEAKKPPVGRGRGRGRGFINPVVVPGSRPSVDEGSSSVIELQSRQAELQPVVELEKRQTGLKPEGMESSIEPEKSQLEGRSEDKSNILAGAAEQLVATDDAESLQDNQPEETTVDMLAVCKLFGRQEDLRSYETKTFVISAFYSPQKLFIIPCAALKDDFADLLDEINDFCLDASSLSEDPVPGSGVCAPKEDETMHRAVVLRKIRNSHFVVRFLDTGEERKVSLADLKPLPDNLYKVPLIGFMVKLKGIPDELPLLSLREFHTNFVPRVIKQKWKLSEVSQLQDGTWEVKLDTKTASLAESILKLQVWQWESHFKSGCHNDTEIYEAQEWPYAEVLQFMPSDFPPEPIPMELSGIDHEKCRLAFKNVKHRRIKAEADVLRRQLCRYIDHVTATPHYPKIKENFLFLPDSKQSVHRFWRRAIRLDQSYVYSHDTHEYFRLEGPGETRRLCPEFFKVPALAILGAIKGEKSATREFLKTLTIGKFYRVSIEGFNEEDQMLVISIES